jgi:acyl-CoA synthetase (AMP-forming)/AMP-acid ligase II
MNLIRPKRHLFDIFSEQVDRQPDALYLTCNEITYTYQQASDLICSVAGQILDGIAPESTLALNYEDPLKFIVSFWACIRLDMSILLLPDVPANSMDIYFHGTGREPVILTDHQGFNHTLSLSFDMARSSSSRPRRTFSQPSKASIYFFSSGTTGPSKMVTTSYFQFVHALDCLARERIMPYIYQQSVLITLPLYHSYGLSAALEYTMGGSHLYLPGLRDFMGSLRLLTNPNTSEDITAIEGVPYFYQQVKLLLDRVKLVNLKHIGMGGDRVCADLMTVLRTHYPEVSCSIRYGVTDIPSVIGLAYLTAGDAFKAGGIGRILPIYQLHSHQSQALDGRAEELLVGCRLHEDLWVSVATGDLFHRQGDQLYFESRQVFLKHRGYKINPVVIEAQLERHPQVRCAKVYLHGDRLSADLMLNEDVADFSGIRKFLAERSPPYQIPERWRQVDAMERTSSGKIKRNNTH